MTERRDETRDRAAIEASGLDVTYADGTRAVRGIDMRVPAGEFFGFLGPNGAGKTTTIKVLATLLSPTGGTVSVNGFDVRDQPRAVRESIGYMPQETSVDPELTARENLRYACESYGIGRARRGERIDELLELVELADVANKRAEEFSGGMKKRLDAATALVHEPPLVFLDEPTTGLDPKARNRLWDYFRRINDRGTTVFLTTQYLEEADQLCDRLSVIVDGEIVADGAPAELKRRVGGEILEVQIPASDDHSGSGTDASRMGGSETAASGTDASGTEAGDATASETAAGDGPRGRAATVARESGLFTDATVEVTNVGIEVTAPTAREHGTDLLIALRDAGVTVTGFDVRAPTLDDVFLAITGDTLDAESEADDAEQAAARADGGDR